MANRKGTRDQKKREKQKKKRAAARKTRGSRPAPVQAATADPGIRGCESWPLTDCALSANWSDPGARVQAAFVRESAEGRCAAAFFEVDLAEQGVVEVLARGGVSFPAVQGELARRSELCGHAMHVVEPALVAKLVNEGLAHGRSNGHSDPAGLEEALALFGDLDPEDAPESIVVGPAPEPPPKKKSLFSVLFG